MLSIQHGYKEDSGTSNFKELKVGWKVRQGSRYCDCDVGAMTKAGSGSLRCERKASDQILCSSGKTS